MAKLLKLVGIVKTYGKQLVLDNISFGLEEGQIIGLIGPSGSGKSTMIKTGLGMEKADSGDAFVLESKMPNRKILSHVGYMAQSDALYENLTGMENLAFFACMKGVEKARLSQEISYVAEVVDLSADLHKLVSGYSGGMKRRLSLAIALLGQPDVLILDEPTVGIDPVLRRAIWKELTILRDKGMGILVTTHVMDEAELCDQVGLLLDGRLIALDSPDALKKAYAVRSIEEVFLKAEVKS